jgi:alkylation response protein AidB-like acyl-CoA dehydrogenase
MATPRVCLAGSGAVGGVAERDVNEGKEGWRLSGEWLHASGAPMATHFTVNARLQQGGQALLDAEGEPRIEAFVLPAAQVRLLDSWHPLGLRATASQGFVIENQWLDDAQRFAIIPEAATADGPLYRFPFEPLAFTTLAANLSGLAREFLRLAEQPLSRPRALHLRDRLERAGSELAAVRELFYAGLDAAWAQVAAGHRLPDADAEALNTASRSLVAQTQAAVQAIYPLCGLQAADSREPINRVWRDLHTASQHAIWLPR